MNKGQLIGSVDDEISAGRLNVSDIKAHIYQNADSITYGELKDIFSVVNHKYNVKLKLEDDDRLFSKLR